MYAERVRVTVVWWNVRERCYVTARARSVRQPDDGGFCSWARVCWLDRGGREVRWIFNWMRRTWDKSTGGRGTRLARVDRNPKVRGQFGHRRPISQFESQFPRWVNQDVNRAAAVLVPARGSFLGLQIRLG